MCCEREIFKNAFSNIGTVADASDLLLYTGENNYWVRKHFVSFTPFSLLVLCIVALTRPRLGIAFVYNVSTLHLIQGFRNQIHARQS